MIMATLRNLQLFIPSENAITNEALELYWRMITNSTSYPMSKNSDIKMAKHLLILTQWEPVLCKLVDIIPQVKSKFCK